MDSSVLRQFGHEGDAEAATGEPTKEPVALG
jgi:hypothetical protein